MEREVKITLSNFDDLQKVIDYIKQQSTAVLVDVQNQTNIIYTNEYLLQHKIAVRKRTIAERNILTIKYKLKQEDGYFQSQEENIDLKKEEADDFPKQPTKYLPKWLADELVKTNNTSIQVFATILTKRTTIKYKGFTLELDHVTSPLEICEIECETEQPDEYKQLIEVILKDLNISWQFSKHSKLERVRQFMGAK